MMDLYAIGKVNDNLWVVLQQDWQTSPKGIERPVWVRLDLRWYSSYLAASNYLQATSHPTRDTRVKGWVEVRTPVDMTRVGAVFAEVAAVHDYLVRN